MAGVGERPGREEDLDGVGPMVTPTVYVKVQLGFRCGVIVRADLPITRVQKKELFELW